MSMPDFEFKCPLCGKSMICATESIGKVANCPHCGEEIYITDEPSSVPDVEDEAEQEKKRMNSMWKASLMSRYHFGRDSGVSGSSRPEPPDLPWSWCMELAFKLAICFIPVALFFELLSCIFNAFEN